MIVFEAVCPERRRSLFMHSLLRFYDSKPTPILTLSHHQLLATYIVFTDSSLIAYLFTVSSEGPSERNTICAAVEL